MPVTTLGPCWEVWSTRHRTEWQSSDRRSAEKFSTSSVSSVERSSTSWTSDSFFWRLSFGGVRPAEDRAEIKKSRPELWTARQFLEKFWRTTSALHNRCQCQQQQVNLSLTLTLGPFSGPFLNQFTTFSALSQLSQLSLKDISAPCGPIQMILTNSEFSHSLLQ